MKKLMFVALLATLAGCSQREPVPQIQYVYEVVWITGTNEYNSIAQRFYTDEIRYTDRWIIFKDKAQGSLVRLASDNVVIYGGN